MIDGGRIRESSVECGYDMLLSPDYKRINQRDQRVSQFKNHYCLGQIPKKYRKYCSQDCPTAALCVLLVLGEYFRQDRIVSPFQGSIDTGTAE
jgi:hypothetical protein